MLGSGWVYAAGLGWTAAFTFPLAVGGTVVIGTLNAEAAQPAPFSIIAQYSVISIPVGIRVFGTPDLRNCWEIIQSSSNLILRKVTFNSAGSTVATAAHGVSAGQPYTLEVRVVGTVISAYINGSTSALWSYDITGDSLAGFTSFGFAGSTQGVFLNFTYYTLNQTFVESADMMWAVANGNLDVWIDGANQQTIGSGIFPPNVPVYGQAIDQTLRLVGGGKAYKFDIVGMTVTPWNPSSGTLPGQTTVGTTTSLIVSAYNGRAALTDQQNGFFSAINNADDFNTGSPVSGNAFTLSATIAGLIGDPIVAIFNTTKQALLILTTNSSWLLQGDPAVGNAQTVRITEEYGFTSQTAVVLVDPGIVAHSTLGLVSFNSSGTATPMSQPVLTTYLSGVNLTSRRVTLIRDAVNALLYTFLTDPAGGQQQHVIYDERIGKYQIPLYDVDQGKYQKGAGYFIDLYPERVGPMAACMYLGQVMLLGRDGWVYTFDPAVTSDDGDPIECFAAFALVVPDQDIRSSVQITGGHVVLSTGSGPVQFRIFGGISPEDAYGANRFLLLSDTLSNTRNEIIASVQAPVLVAEFYSNSTTSQWRFEGGQVEYMPSPLMWAGNSAPAAAPAPSKLVTSTTSSTSPNVASGPQTGTAGTASHWSEQT